MECQSSDRNTFLCCFLIFFVIGIGLLIPVISVLYVHNGPSLSFSSPCHGLSVYLNVFLLLVIIFITVTVVFMTAILFCFFHFREAAKKKWVYGVSLLYVIIIAIWNIYGTVTLIRLNSCSQLEAEEIRAHWESVYQLTEAVVIVLHLLLDCPIALVAFEWYRSCDDDIDKDIGELRPS